MRPRRFGVRKKALRWFLLPTLAGIVLLLAFSRTIPVEQALLAMRRFGPEALSLACLAGIAQITLQGSRLYVLLPRGSDASWLEVVRVFSLGQLANTLLPARAGDALKVVSFSRSPEGRRNSLARAAGGVLVADKVVDASAVALLAGVLAGTRWLAGPTLGLRALGIGSLALAVLGTAVAPGADAGRLRGRLGGWLRHLVEGSSALADPRRLLLGLVFGIAAWTVEACVLVGLTAAAHHEITLANAVWLLALLNVGIAVPLTPANVGTFEAALGFGLSRSGVPVPDALAVATVHHALQIVAVGALAIASRAHQRVLGRRRVPARSFRVQPADKERAVAYYDASAARYREWTERGVLGRLRQRERRVVLRFACLHDETKWTAIDVGCGDGYYALEAKRAGKRVHAVDLAPAMVEQVRPHVDRAEVGDIETMRPERTYDIVICCGVLEFVSDPETAFANLCRLVSPGGRLVVLVPRSGITGIWYRGEKRIQGGMRVNLYRREWLVDRARGFGLELTGWAHPLPTNVVLRFEAARDGRPPMPSA